MQLYKYTAQVIKVIDGDTIDCQVDLGFKVFHVVRVRLAECNAPELTSKDPTIKTKALQSQTYLSNLILNKTVFFDSKKLDKYGRSIAALYLDNNPNSKPVSTMMVEAGMAVKVKY